MRATRLGLLCGMLFVGVSALTQAAEMRFVPISASGPHTIVGNKIIIASGGERIVADLMISGWAPAELRAYQAVIDVSSYASGLAGSVEPAFVSYVTDADCIPNFGRCSLVGTTCAQDSDCELQSAGETCISGTNCQRTYLGPLTCAPGFITSARRDFVFHGRTIFAGVDVSTQRLRFGVASASGPAGDAGKLQYIGTVVLDVSSDATGTFVLNLEAEPDSTLQDATANSVLPLVIIPLVVAIKCTTNAECNDRNGCTDDVCGASQICVNTPNFDDTVVCCDPTDGSLCERPFGRTGDTDGDFDIDLADAAAYQTCIGSAAPPVRCAGFDLDCDCAAGVGDHALFAPAMTGPSGP